MKNIKTEKDLNSEKKKAFNTIGIYLAFTFIVPVIAMIIGMVLMGGDDSSAKKLEYIVPTILNFIMFFIFAIIYFKRIKIDIKRLNKKTLIFILIFSALAVGLNQIISEIFGFFKIPMSNQNTIVELVNTYKIPWIILGMFLMPFVEEVLFRGALSSIIKNKTIFVIVSSITFGIMHGFGIVTLLYVFLGFVYAMIYIKTDKNLMASTIAHIINNVFGVLLIIFLS